MSRTKKKKSGKSRLSVLRAVEPVKKLTVKSVTEALAVALILTIFVATGWTADFDAAFSDRLYMHTTPPDDNIVIIRMDRQTLNRLGKLSSWERKKMPEVIEYLNEKDPSSRPAAIGIDRIFPREDAKDPETDHRLAAACARYGNVVMAGMSDMTEEEHFKKGKELLDAYAETRKWVGPYAELAKVTTPGHINIPDGAGSEVVRHMPDYVHTDAGDIPSFAAALYRMWCENTGRVPKPPPVTGANGIYYLPYSSDEYKTYSLIDLLDGKIPGEVYRDKIVMIGLCFPGMETYHTPEMSSNVMYRVMLHANVVTAYERGFFPREVPDKWQLALFFLICATAEYFFRTRKPGRVILSWAVLSAGSLIFCSACYGLGFVLHPTWIPGAATVLLLGALAMSYARMKADQIRTSAIFGRYFDATVMKQLLAENSDELKLGGKEREIAVLFVDIRGFTTMSEELSAADIVDILNAYLELTTECVRRYRGTLDKFIGDCTMAFWNAPQPQENAVLLACRAAVGMVQGMKDLQEDVMNLHNRDISFGIGIHWGKAVVGNIGSKIRMDYTAIGDMVNTAARLEANAGGGEIFISREVADILGDNAVCEPLPEEVKLKGKHKSVEVLKLVALDGRRIDAEEAD